MDITTIQLSKETKDKVMEFGTKGETFNDVIERLLKSARERQLHDILMNEESTISIEEALTNAKKRWRK